MTRLLAAAALALALMGSPVVAAPVHPNVITCGRLGCSDHHVKVARRGSYRVRAYRRLDSDPMGFAPYVESVAASSSALVTAARRSIGETAAQMGVRRTLWCMAALNKWLHEAGLRTSGSDEARSSLTLGRHVGRPVVGAIAFMYRRGGGHAGVVSGIDPHGNPIIISGNHLHRVREAVYPKSRISTYVLPSRAGSG